MKDIRVKNRGVAPGGRMAAGRRPSVLRPQSAAWRKQRHWTGRTMTPATVPEMPAGVKMAHDRWDERARARRMRVTLVALLVISALTGGAVVLLLRPQTAPEPVSESARPPRTDDGRVTTSESGAPPEKRPAPDEAIPTISPSKERIVPKSPLRK